jgi:hypothetical protein
VKIPVTWGVNDPPTTADRVGRLLTEDELVDEALEETFPASDPPFWTLGWERPVTTMEFLGFVAKKRLSGIDAGLPDVIEVCSVADCLAARPPGWMERRDFNRACCYPTADAARATIPRGAGSDYSIFGWWLVPGSEEDIFDPSLPALPNELPQSTGPALGFDVVGRGTSIDFGCSPLSCNRRARELRVNEHCLFDALPDAVAAARRFDAEQPEPRKHYVVRVDRIHR